MISGEQVNLYHKVAGRTEAQVQGRTGEQLDDGRCSHASSSSRRVADVYYLCLDRQKGLCEQPDPESHDLLAGFRVLQRWTM